MGTLQTAQEGAVRIIRSAQVRDLKNGLPRSANPLISLDGAAGDRTPDLMTASHALSHLSYSPNALIRG